MSKSTKTNAKLFCSHTLLKLEAIRLVVMLTWAQRGRHCSTTGVNPDLKIQIVRDLITTGLSEPLFRPGTSSSFLFIDFQAVTAFTLSRKTIWPQERQRSCMSMRSCPRAKLQKVKVWQWKKALVRPQYCQHRKMWCRSDRQGVAHALRSAVDYDRNYGDARRLRMWRKRRVYDDMISFQLLQVCKTL